MKTLQVADYILPDTPVCWVYHDGAPFPGPDRLHRVGVGVWVMHWGSAQATIASPSVASATSLAWRLVADPQLIQDICPLCRGTASMWHVPRWHPARKPTWWTITPAVLEL